VKLLVATHWHDDHIAGLPEVLEQCTEAQFVCSQVLTTQEFFELAQFSKQAMTTRPGVQQFAKTLEIVADRKGGRFQSRGPEWASSSKLLYARRDNAPVCEVVALSPSHGEISLFLSQIGSLIPAEGQQQRRTVSIQPNHAAVVLWITVGDTKILLGSDLEETRNPNTGWSVIVESSTRPPGKSSVFKIPHHGSHNAHESRVWSEMVENGAYAVLTPFKRGFISLPTKRDAERILSQTPNSFSTAKLPMSVKRSPTVERTIKEVTRKFRPISFRSGQIRLRKSINETREWKVELFGDAIPLRELVTLL